MFKQYTCIAAVFLLLLTAGTSFGQKDRNKPASYDDKLLFGGCWFVPHNSGVNIRFTENSNFSFQDYDKEKGEVTYAGKYLLDGNNLWLIFNDKPKQKFRFYRGESTETNYYIQGYPLETSKYYFVHGKCD